MSIMDCAKCGDYIDTDFGEMQIIEGFKPHDTVCSNCICGPDSIECPSCGESTLPKFPCWSCNKVAPDHPSG